VPWVQAVSRLVQLSLPPLLLGSPGHQGRLVAGVPASTHQEDGLLGLRVAASQTPALQARLGSPGMGAICVRGGGAGPASFIDA
jgi:hypothetical protein